jgi:hypothetical protein
MVFVQVTVPVISSSGGNVIVSSSVATMFDLDIRSWVISNVVDAPFTPDPIH